jgi:4-oxalocrotonate tautomerase
LGGIIGQNSLKTNGGDIVPIVRVEMWPGRTHAQKAELTKLITEAIVNVAHTTPEATIIIFEDISKENWAIGGVLASDADKQK